jgi:hypothetical protein
MLLTVLPVITWVGCAGESRNAGGEKSIPRCPNAPLVCVEGDYRCTYDSTRNCEACSCVPGVQSPTSPFVPR